jgi:hypothetical protein
MALRVARRKFPELWERFSTAMQVAAAGDATVIRAEGIAAKGCARKE